MSQEHDTQPEIEALNARLDATNKRLDNLIDLLIGDEAEIYEERFEHTPSVWDQLERVQEDVEELQRDNERLQERVKDNEGKKGKLEKIVKFARNKQNGEDVVKVTASEIKGATGVSRRYAYDLVDDLPDEYEWVLTKEDVQQYGNIEMDLKSQQKCLAVDFEGVHSTGAPVNLFTTPNSEKGVAE